MERNERPWRFWVDVGGTFTDCLFQRPDGTEGGLKVLSTAVCKRGKVNQFSPVHLIDPTLCNQYAKDFFCGFSIRFLGDHAEVLAERIVQAFYPETGQLEFHPVELTSPIIAYELQSPESSPLLAMRTACEIRLDEEIPRCELRLGTTRGTNALLTRSGANTALITTAGFADLLEIGDQTRPDLFALNICKAKPLYSTVLEINERILSDGTVEQPLQPAEIRADLIKLVEAGIESLAICLMHGFRFSQHEIAIESIARQLGFSNISRSSAVAPLIKMVPRCETTLIDAYLNPLLVDYLGAIQQQLSSSSRMLLMTSAGTLVTPQRFCGKESILSGPAAGVVGMARAAKSLGFNRAIGFDMGGTSTDVSRFDGRFNYEYESNKAGVRVFSPVMAIETVAAGGGSICRFDGARLLVGPESAGADPGPACYGRSGPLTITDVNVFLGRLSPQHFPFPLDCEAIEFRLKEIASQVHAVPGSKFTLHQLAEGFLKIANAHMATAVHTVSVAKGFDARAYALVGFGGAAGQHVCAVADQLQITRAILHPAASLLSAFGIRHAKRSATGLQSILKPLGELSWVALSARIEELKSTTSHQLTADDCSIEAIEFRVEIELRYAATESYLAVPIENEQFVETFEREHQRQFGYLLERSIEVGAIHVFANQQAELETEIAHFAASFKPHPDGATSMYADGQAETVDLFQRAALMSGAYIDGPAVIVDPFTTVIVDSRWRAICGSDGQIILERLVGSGAAVEVDETRQNDPVMLEVFNNHFQAIANQMGITLQKTSCSVNVKERLDFSCAIFDADGDLVVSAQHIPVHLGAMSETVKNTLRLNPHLKPGDVFATNDPFQGGSHLPDVTVITPVFVDKKQSQPLFFVASRSHHAEIGGVTPGSMPPNSTSLADEGVLISNFKLFDRDTAQFEALTDLLTTAEYPSRSPEINVTDIKAQVAANRRGEQDLLLMIAQFGDSTISHYMKMMLQAAETKARSAIGQLSFEKAKFEDHLDNGLKICVTIERHNDRLVIDFAGTSPTSSGNHNANRGIVAAAVMYSLRCMIAEDIPLNQGLLAAVDIQLPDCFLNPRPATDPRRAPAMAAGNVETSQRIVDVLLAALGLAAASQGTMNNLIIGDDSFGYYETIGGGAGATAVADGASAVHTHMTNTRLTDPEIMETSLPLVVRQFSIRKNSGGRGKFHGGNGICRSLEFLRTLTVTLLTNRRGEHSPFGLLGGTAGKSGENWLVRAGEPPVELASCCSFQVDHGDQLIINTPGGGGFGKEIR